MTRSPLPPEPIGWPLFAVPDAQGQLSYPSLADSVRQSMQVILSTRPNEQLMRPRFGAGLSNFLQEPNTLLTRRRVRDAVFNSIQRWEQRVLLDRVDVLEVRDRPTHIRVEITYRIRRTGVAQTMGLTMQLEG
ncbi:MAG: GPW/gp25 family protein [Leptolyngbyaceae cyanobacterium]